MKDHAPDEYGGNLEDSGLSLYLDRRGLTSSSGDHVGNLVSPFWPVLLAGIARVDFRTFFGYGVIFALLWFVLGVALVTVVPPG